MTSILEITENVELSPARSETLEIVDQSGNPINRNDPAGDILIPSNIQEKSIEKAEKDETGNFIWKAIRDSYDPDTNVIRDLTIDDRDIPMAKNYYDFCARVAGKSVLAPFARQMFVAMHIFGEYCPRCTDRKWFTNILDVPVDMDIRDYIGKLTLLNRGTCPKCGVTRAKLAVNGEIQIYNQLALLLGQRSGKSAFTTTCAATHLHYMLKSPRISTICRGIQDFTPLTYTFVALSASRAIRLLWSPFKQLVSNSGWFNDYFKMLDYYGSKYGKELYRLNDLSFKFNHRNIELYPIGPLKRALRGDTRCFSAVDELDWFPFRIPDEGEEEDSDNEQEHANGDEVHLSLDNSLLTFRTEVLDLYRRNISIVPNGLNFNISSVHSNRAKLSRLYEESKDPELLIFGLRLATWEMNPIYTRENPIIAAAYKRNYVMADRDYGSVPPRVTSSIFEGDKVLPMFRESEDSLYPIHKENTHKVIYDSSEDPSLTVARIVEILPRGTIRPQSMGVDAGITNNSFSMVIGERDGSRIIVHTIIEIIPTPGTKLHYPSIYSKIIKPVILQCNICVVGADRFNSVYILQQIQEDTDGKCKAVQLTLNSTHAASMVEAMGSQLFSLPALEMTREEIESVSDYKKQLKHAPVSHLYLQMITVKQNSRNNLDKGDGYTDDTFRALYMLYTLLTIPRFQQHIENSLTKTSNRGATAVNMGASFSMGRSQVAFGYGRYSPTQNIYGKG